MKSFSAYYMNEIKKCGNLDNYIFRKAKEKKPLLDRVIKYSPNKRVIEIGSGSSVNSIYLSRQGFKVVCVDYNNEILGLIKNMLKNKKENLCFKNQNIFKLRTNKEFDVAFNHGVLEHYSDGDIIKLINHGLKIANTLIFSVPSSFFRKREAIQGDERFLSLKQWKQIICRSNGVLLEVFSYYHDSDELKIKIYKLLSMLSLGFFPINKPYLGFVVGG